MMALLFAALFAVAPPSIQDFSNIASIATMDGSCTKLVLGGDDVTARCKPVLLNTAYRNDRSSFMAAVGADMLVSFYGEDHAANGNTATLTIRKITTTRLPENKPKMIDAEGECRYTNPYAGVSHVDCAAVAAGLRYEFSFVSDGKPPSVHRP